MDPRGPHASELSLVLNGLGGLIFCRSLQLTTPALTGSTFHVKELKGARGGLRMYYDLNVPYTANYGELQRTLAFLSER